MFKNIWCTADVVVIIVVYFNSNSQLSFITDSLVNNDSFQSLNSKSLYLSFINGSTCSKSVSNSFHRNTFIDGCMFVADYNTFYEIIKKVYREFLKVERWIPCSTGIKTVCRYLDARCQRHRHKMSAGRSLRVFARLETKRNFRKMFNEKKKKKPLETILTMIDECKYTVRNSASKERVEGKNVSLIQRHYRYYSHVIAGRVRNARESLQNPRIHYLYHNPHLHGTYIYIYICVFIDGVRTRRDTAVRYRGKVQRWRWWRLREG